MFDPKKRGWRPYLLALMSSLFLAGASVYAADTAVDRNLDRDTANPSATAPDRSSTMSGTYGAAGQQAFSPDIQRAHDLIGLKVQNAAGESLGKIEEIVLHTGDNRIAYAVLSFGGFLGMGDKYFAIPWNAFQLRQTGSKASDHVLVLNVDKDRLKGAPGFDKNNWPDMANPAWGTEINQYYQGSVSSRDMDRSTGYAAGAADRDLSAADRDRNEASRDQGTYARSDKLHGSLVKLSDVIGWKVDHQNGTIGKVSDVMIDMREGRVAYALIELNDKIQGMNDKYAIVPWSVLNVEPQQKLVRLNADADTIKSFAYDKKQIPNLSDQSFAQRIYDRYSVEPYWETYGYVGGTDKSADMGMHRFDVNAVTTIKGTVVAEGATEALKSGAGGLEHLTIKTDDGRDVLVSVAPQSFVQSRNLSFRNGDRITVTGSLRSDNAGKQFILASKIEKGDQVYLLRDEKGQPLWMSDMKSGTQGMDNRNMKSPGASDRSTDVNPGASY